jgi:AbrB family looped-hinge helix DNA binding protein
MNTLLEHKPFTRTITQKGQVTIPTAVREFLQLEKRDAVTFEITGESVVLKRPEQLSLHAVFGAVTPRNRPEDFQKMRDDAIEEHIERTSSS